MQVKVECWQQEFSGYFLGLGLAFEELVSLNQKTLCFVSSKKLITPCLARK